MSSNRFDTSQTYQPVSSYVPLPFEQIGALGAKMTQEHAAKQAEADALADQLSKIKVANQVLSEGSGDDLGIKYRDTGYGDFKNQVLNKYTLANKQLADEYQAGKLDATQFAQKVSQLKSDFSNDYQKLKIAEANSVAIEEADKKYREAKHAGANPFVLNQLAEEGARLRANPFGNEYKGAPIGEVADLEDLKNKYASNFKSQILSSGAGSIDSKTGYITWRDKSGVTKQRIRTSVENTFDQDPVLGSQTKEQTWRFLRDRGLDWNSEVTLKDGSKVKAGDYYYKSLKEDFIGGVIAKAESSEQNVDRKKDWMFADDRKAAAEEKKATDALNLKGNAIPGTTVDVLANDKDFQNLSTKGLLSVGIDGKVNINWDNISSGTIYDIRDVSGKVIASTYDYADAENQRKTSNGAISSITPRKTNDNTENSTELRNFITKAAKVVGFDDNYIAKLKRGEIAGQSWSGQMQNIVTAYNVLIKSKLGGVQLPSDVQEIESQRVMNSPESYTVYNPVTHNPTGTVLHKGDVVKTGERIYIDGQAYNKSIIQRQVKGEGPITEEVLLKPQSRNSQDYFDRGLGSTQKAVMDLFVSGGKPDPKHIENYDPNKDKPGEIATIFARGTLSNEDGKKVSYTFTRAKNNLNHQIYTLHTPEGEKSFDDYNEFLVHADAAYYLYGRGKADATALKNKFKFERVQESTLSDNNQDNEE